MQLSSFSHLFGSNIGKTIRLLREIPLLTSATADNEEATPGYMIEQVIALTFDSYKSVNEELVYWLNGRLGQKSLCIKLKVLKLFIQLVLHGSSRFKEVLRKHSSEISTTARLAGLARNSQMAGMYELIRNSSKEILQKLYSSDSEDEPRDYKKDRSKYHGFGNTCNMQGFGNTLPAEESLLSSLTSELAKLSSPRHSVPQEQNPNHSYVLNTTVPQQTDTAELVLLAEQESPKEELEKVLLDDFIHSPDPLFNRRVRKLLNAFHVLDRQRFIYCLKEHIDNPHPHSLMPSLLLIEALLHTNLYNSQDLATLFKHQLNYFNSRHLDTNVSTKAKKIVLSLDTLLRQETQT